MGMRDDMQNNIERFAAAMESIQARSSRLAIDPPLLKSFLKEKVQEYETARTALINYLTHKLEICDWHGVRDAAVDIEILEAKYNIP